MTTSWLELKRPLEPHFVRLLGDLDDVLQTQGVPYLLSGAMAREILLHYGHGCASGRKTTDMDFGVTVRDWEAYEAIKAALVACGRFRLDQKEAQRVIHSDTETGTDTRVDLVPFGRIAGPDGSISWPPDGAHIMHVLGYEQALASAIRLRIDGTRGIPMASAAGQAILKLVAHRDRAKRTQGRDAADFYELLRHHADTLTDEQLYDVYPEAMARYEFRPEPAGAWILGRQVSKMIDGQLRHWLATILAPDARSRLLDGMLREYQRIEQNDQKSEAGSLLSAFEQGLGSGDDTSL
ncbi:MAG: nucleotidyl transferase AbiEii/AbiGii toxin family protein [Geothrix sp.]|nr:nucleotidyl transferase AbiEii/AbiGii toxin family protein [Geothrix sp.]